MTDEPHSIAAPEKPHVHTLLWVAMVGIVALAAALAVGYTEQTEINATLTKQLTALETAQKSAPTVTSAQLAALQSLPTLAETVKPLPDQLSQQSDRLDALEKTTAQNAEQLAAITARLDAIKTSTAKQPVVEEDAPAEEPAAKKAETPEKKPDPIAENPHSWIARINRQFEGILHITRHAPAGAP